MSKLLKKALKSAVLPSALLVSGKFLSTFILISIFNESLSLTNNVESVFSIQLYLSDPIVAMKVNSISNLITLLLIAIPTMYFLLRATLLYDAQSNPRIVVKLTKLNILKWVTGQESSIIKVTIWTAFLWIISGICISSTIEQGTYSWIGVLAGVLSLIASFGILKTFEKETARIYPEDNGRYF